MGEGGARRVIPGIQGVNQQGGGSEGNPNLIKWRSRTTTLLPLKNPGKDRKRPEVGARIRRKENGKL